MLEAGNRYSLPNFSAMGRSEMTDFYEELADFAAMSEEDGFLGQCASTEANLPATLAEVVTSGECGIAPMRRRPQQLQLLVVLADHQNVLTFFQSPFLNAHDRQRPSD